MNDASAGLHRYLQLARDVMLWKLEGLSDYDVRRPLTPTGTNLLGMVKHLASVEFGYFGVPFGRPHSEPLPWFDDGAEPDADMWATPDESRADVVALYRRAWAHTDATIAALDLDASGRVPHWPADRAQVTLRLIVVHMIAETNRHAGHADILRESLDGAAGHRAEYDNMGGSDRAALYDRIERAAREAAGGDRLTR